MGISCVTRIYPPNWRFHRLKVLWPAALPGLVFGMAHSGAARDRLGVPMPVPTVINEVPPPPQISRVRYIARAQRMPLGRAPIGAKAYLLMDVDSGRILIEHNARTRMFPASTTKTMTALVAIEDGDLDAVVGIGANPPKTGEQSINLLEREKFALRDLVRAAMIKSANDSCVAIAEGVAGTMPAFVKLMNAKAQAIGARHTHFVNPHGLHDPRHYSTAHDLALIARAAMQHREFNRIIGTQQTTIHGNWKQGPLRPLINRNRLMLRWNPCDGVKTGYTRQAGNCLVASATQIDASGKPWRLLAVTLHSKDIWNDCYNLLQKQGFERFQPHTVAAAGEIAGEIHAQGGAREGQAIVRREVRVPLLIGDQSTLTRRVHLSDVTAPVRRGQKVGHLEIAANGRRVLTVPLVAKEEIALSAFARVLPSAAPMLPSDPQRRLFGYSLLAGAAALLMCAWKARNPKPRRRRSNRRRAGHRTGSSGPSDFETFDEGAVLSAATERRAGSSPRSSSAGAPRATNASNLNSHETPQSFSATRLETDPERPSGSKATSGHGSSQTGTDETNSSPNLTNLNAPTGSRLTRLANAGTARPNAARATQTRRASQAQAAAPDQSERPDARPGARRRQSH